MGITSPDSAADAGRGMGGVGIGAEEKPLESNFDILGDSDGEKRGGFCGGVVVTWTL